MKQKDGANSTPSAPDEAEKGLLRTLAGGVIRAQGNSFIKELLRSKKLRIGATKQDFERNLLDAIDGGQLRLGEVTQWLDEVEGWGNQHIYLFQVSEELASTEVLSNPETLQRKVEESEFAQFWDAPTSHLFPETLQLTSIRFDGDSLRLIWHEGDKSWVRGKAEESLDEERVIGLDQYEFRAYRQISRRSVMRFELRRRDRLAALFLSLAFEEKEHDAAMQAVFKVLGSLFDVSLLLRGQVAISDVIKNLDQAITVGAKPAAAQVRVQSTRLTGGLAYLEMGSSTDSGSYPDDTTIGAVRQAIRSKELTTLSGTSSNFEFLMKGNPTLKRDIGASLHGPQRRVRLWKLLEGSEVWAILKFLAGYQ